MSLRALLAAAVLAMLPAALAEAEELTISTGEYEPFTGSSLSDDGTVNAHVATIAREAGFEPIFVYLPWKRALKQAETGTFAATSFWYFLEDREADFFHVGPIMQDRLVFFRRNETALPDWNTLGDLSGLRIGVVPGYTYTPELWELGQTGSLTLSEGPSDVANFRKLLAGRIDLLPISEEAGWLLIERELGADAIDRLVVERQPLSVTDGWLLISRAHPDGASIAERLQRVVNAQTDPSAMASQ